MPNGAELWSMNAVIVVLAAICVVSVIYWLVAVGDLSQWLRARPSKPNISDEVMPVTFLRPIKPGVPALRQTLEALLASARAGDQIVFGTDEASAEAELCTELRSAFPECDIAVVHCRAGAALNPKISKLLAMTPLARHSHWILSDSEALLDRNFTEAFREEWRASGADVLTSPYRFIRAVSWPQRLDAVATLLGLWPGLAVVRARGSVRFTLGACTALRGEAVEAVGGWARFQDELAEDHRLGEALSAIGQRIQLGGNVVALASDPLTWRAYWHHQRRVAITYRVANPAGFAGMLLIQGAAACLLLAATLVPISPAAGCLGCAVVLAVRWQTARSNAALVGAALPDALTIFVASLVETVCWFGAWVLPHITWAGREWHVSPRGKLRPKP